MTCDEQNMTVKAAHGPTIKLEVGSGLRRGMKGVWAGFKKTAVADKHMTGNGAEQYLQLVCELESPAFLRRHKCQGAGMRR